MRLLEHLKLKNLLSFGPKGIDLELRDLNLFIGPNGSGKSNLIEAIGLLIAMPTDFAAAIRQGGGFRDWLWLGDDHGASGATIEAVVHSRFNSSYLLKHQLVFQTLHQRVQVASETIEDEVQKNSPIGRSVYYHNPNGGLGYFLAKNERLSPTPEEVDPQQSILALRRDPKKYRQITELGDHYRYNIAIYRDWKFGHSAPARQPQKTDLPNDKLLPDCSNLVMVLNRLAQNLQVKRKLLEYLGKFIDGVVDYNIKIEGGTAQFFLHEGSFDRPIPATRLSDGTLRYLCLLAILLDPEPPCVVCIEEPELGLHPDCIVTVGDLLIEASKRQSPRPIQLIVTTHSNILVDAMTDRVEDVVVCERNENGTTMQRLRTSKLKPWLKDYSLGQLWSRGEIGGNRW